MTPSADCIFLARSHPFTVGHANLNSIMTERRTHHRRRQVCRHCRFRPILCGLLLSTTTNAFAPVLLLKSRLRQRTLSAPLSSIVSPSEKPQPVIETGTTLQTTTSDAKLHTPVFDKPPNPKDNVFDMKPSLLKKQIFGCLVHESTRFRAVGTPTRHDTENEPDGPDIAPRSKSPIPHINSAPVFGLRPHSPAQYLIATTGSRPMHFSLIRGQLPVGLCLDTQNGVITGRTEKQGTFNVTLMATNQFGVATHPLTIQVGDTIALTPPRGISTWNSCGDQISESKIRDMAQQAIRLQLRDHGYTYLNIDDGWQGSRRSDGTLQPNEKFGDMKQLTDDLHALGFHCGIYGTPWKWSYAFYPGGSSDPQPWLQGKPSFYIPNLFGWRLGQTHYEEQDADYFASIGADFVKWDWYQNDLASTRRMAKALRRQPRDMVYSLSNSAPLRSAPHYRQLSNMVRTTADIRDAWDSHSPRDAFCLGIREIWRIHEKWAPYCGPGHFTDPDMLVVGPVGWGCRGGTKGRRPEPLNHLTRDEQLTHMTLWILWAAPLIVGCDLEKIDDKTLDMLCNRGALNINQDSMGRQGETISRKGDAVVVAKPLSNGDVAVGLFNTGRGHRQVSVTWEELGLDQADLESVKDIWADRYLDVADCNGDAAADYNNGLRWSVREHSAKLFRVGCRADD